MNCAALLRVRYSRDGSTFTASFFFVSFWYCWARVAISCGNDIHTQTFGKKLDVDETAKKTSLSAAFTWEAHGRPERIFFLWLIVQYIRKTVECRQLNGVLLKNKLWEHSHKHLLKLDIDETAHKGGCHTNSKKDFASRSIYLRSTQQTWANLVSVTSCTKYNRISGNDCQLIYGVLLRHKLWKHSHEGKSLTLMKQHKTAKWMAYKRKKKNALPAAFTWEAHLFCGALLKLDLLYNAYSRRVGFRLESP